MDTLAKIESSGEEADASQIVRLKISVGGIVQGVGFRPFIYRLAHRYGLAGLGSALDPRGLGGGPRREEPSLTKRAGLC